MMPLLWNEKEMVKDKPMHVIFPSWAWRPLTGILILIMKVCLQAQRMPVWPSRPCEGKVNAGTDTRLIIKRLQTRITACVWSSTDDARINNHWPGHHSLTAIIYNLLVPAGTLIKKIVMASSRWRPPANDYVSVSVLDGHIKEKQAIKERS